MKRMLAVAVMLLATAALADASWKGARKDSAVDWTLASNWDGDVPTGDARVTIAYNDTARMLTMTPPVDFTGTIVCGGDKRDWASGVASTLRLNVLPGATWTVGHIAQADQKDDTPVVDGTLVATSGLDKRISSDFTGLVLIPAGVTFTAYSTLNDAVEFAGDGVLELTKTEQLAHALAFTGTVIWSGPSELSPEDTAVLQRHKIRLGDGQSIKLSEKMLSLHASRAFPDFTESASWSFNGGAPFQSKSTAYVFDNAPPSVNAAGELELVNDCGQKHSVVFKDQCFNLCDVWGIHFRLKTAMPSATKYAGKSRENGGYFGIYLVPSTAAVSTSDVLKDGPMPLDQSSGVCVDFSTDVLAWQRPNDGDRYLGIDRAGRTAVGGGVMFISSTVDVDISFANCVMTIVVSQDGKMFAMRRTRFDATAVRNTMPNGYYIALGGSGGWNGDDKPVFGTMMSVSNFGGWYRAREAGAWEASGSEGDYYPFSSDNWRVKSFDNNGTCVEGDAAIENDGSFLSMPGAKNRRTLLGSYKPLSTSKRYLIEWDYAGGAGEGDVTTQHIRFGLLARPNASPFTGWPFNYADLQGEWFDNYSRAFGFAIQPGDGKFRFRSMRAWWVTDHDEYEIGTSPWYAWPTTWRNQTLKMQFLYDGNGGQYLQAQSRSGGTMLIDRHYIPAESHGNWFRGRSMYLCFMNNQTWGYTTTYLKNLSVKELVGNSSPYLSADIDVAPNATVALNADAYDTTSTMPATSVRMVTLAAGANLEVTTAVEGSRVAIDALRVAGNGATVSATAKTVVGGLVFEGESAQTQAANLSGDVAFADGTLTLVIPEAWRHSKNPVPLFKGAQLPASYQIVTDEGKDITKRVALTVKDGETVLSRLGLVIVVQ